MSTPFDPYAEWLEIGPEEQPPDHYRLLGLARFESDPEQIRNAADERMARVRRYQTGPKAMQSQELLNALAAARMCLLNADTRSSYDAVLQGQDAAQLSAIRSPTQLPSGSEPFAANAPSRTPTSLDRESHTHSGHSPISVAARPENDERDDQLPIGLLAALVGLAALLIGMAVAGAILWTRWKAEPIAAFKEPHSGDGESPVAGETRTDFSTADDMPVLVYPELGGEINLSAASALLSDGLELIIHEGENAIANWTSREDEARWRCLIQEGGIHKIEVTYAVMPDAENCEFTFECGNDRDVHSLSLRGGAGVFVTDEFFLAIRRSGELPVRIRTDTPTTQGMFELRSVRISRR